MKKVAVIGAGTMGHCIAMIFAQAGYQVGLNDTADESLDKAMSLIAANLETQAEAGLFDLAESSAVLERIECTTDLAKAAADTDLVIEAVFERADIKEEIFKRLDQAAPPGAILASNTSYLDIYKFVKTSRPDKVIIAHWFAPPHIVPLVEIVPGPGTSEETITATKDILEKLGKETIVLRKFLPGFIINRLQAALKLEVLYLLDNGYISGEDMDKAVKNSLALRMPIVGLVQRFDFTGLDLTQQSLINKSYTPPEVKDHSVVLEELLAKGRKGVKNGKGFYDYGGRTTEDILHERDLKLLSLRSFLEKLN